MLNHACNHFQWKKGGKFSLKEESGLKVTFFFISVMSINNSKLKGDQQEGSIMKFGSMIDLLRSEMAKKGYF